MQFINSYQGSNQPRCANCIMHKRKMYKVHEKTGMTWFDAKQYCSQQNMTLAVLPQGEMSTIIDLLTPESKNKIAWIGLKLTDYYVQNMKGMPNLNFNLQLPVPNRKSNNTIKNALELSKFYKTFTLTSYSFNRS